MNLEYERLAVDGEGDTWGYRSGRWSCLTEKGSCDDDAELAATYGGAVFYEPAEAR